MADTISESEVHHHPDDGQHHHHHALHLAKPRDRHDEEYQEDIRIANLLAKEVEELPREYFTSIPLVGTMVSMSLTVVSSYFGFAVPASVLTFINLDIGPSNDMSLFSIVWTLCNAISLLITGRVSDKFGRRNFVLGAGALAIIGGIVACTAKNMNTLIGANVIIGLASGVHSSQSLFTGELLPHRYKFLAVFMMLIPMVISTGLAAYIARALVETRSWRWIYYIYLILVGEYDLLTSSRTGSGWIIQILVYHPPTFDQLHGGHRSRRREFKRMDHFGLFLLVAGLTLFILGVSWGGNPQPWTSGRILGLLITGGVTLIIFVIYEVYTPSPNPIVDMTLFKDIRGYVCLNIVSMAAGAMYIALNVIWPQRKWTTSLQSHWQIRARSLANLKTFRVYFTEVVLVYGSENRDWQTSAWMSTAIGWGIWGGIMILFPLVSVIKHLRRQVLVLLIFSLAFTAALSQVNRSQKSQAIAFAFLTAFPIGWLETGTTIMVQLDAQDADVGMVYAVLSGLRSISGAVFTAVFVAILNSKATAKVGAYVTRAALQAGLPQSSLVQLFQAIQTQSAEALASVPGITTEIQVAVARAAEDAYADAFAYVYYAALAVGGVAVLAALYMKDYDRYMTGHTPKQIYGRGGVGPELRVNVEKKDIGEDVKTHHVASHEEESVRPSERIRNRLSQRHFRERKSLYIKSLEKASKASTQTESARNKALSKELADLRTATLKMRAQILKLSCSLHAVGTEVGKILHVKGLEDSGSTPGLQDTNPMSSPLSNLAYEEESSSPGGLNPGNLSDEYAEYPELTELNLQPHHTEHDNERLSRSEASQRTDTGHETRPPDETSNDNVPVLNPSPSSADDLQPETGTHQGEQHPSHHFVNHNGSLPNATVQAASPEWGFGDPNSLEFYSQPMGPMGFQVYGTTFASPRAATRMTSPAAVGASATASFDTAQQVAGQTLHTHTAAPGHPDLTVHQRASLQQAGQHQEHQHQHQQHGPDPLLQSVPGQTNLSLPAGHFPPWFGGDLSPNNPSSAFARHMETLELQVRCRIDAAPDGSSREK
ncbi:hypothetical protein AYO21_01498 [Fonsecaea monophora]|uniref:Major facilitator superfamily (MFS) profile domain-containing protein n=1 Tax=Fonsecaea monophora TaxID=254056 RepID=A0A177FME6_9EURO|nr:hypothetical protein AYO21_01498 [Fonsecaea monophora]OAG44502.1 hypothetical protein AYO21_01498 [Fonsecaea monophora]